MAAGTGLGWTSPTGSSVVTNSSDTVGEYKFYVSSQEWSWIGSLMTLGAAITCLFIGVIISKLGRKLTMLLLIIPFTIGWGLVIFATNVSMLYVGRFLLGIAGGAFCITAPMYTAEIAQSDIRGSLGSYFQLMLVIGVLFSYVIGTRTSVFGLSVICATIPLIFGAIFVFMPETPAYLISKGKKEEAAKSLKWLRGSQYDYSGELAELQTQHEENSKNKVSIGSAILRKASIKAIFISLSLMFFQQMSGINAVIFYTKDIFDAAQTGLDSGLATIIVGIMQVISVFVSSLIVDKLGRRILLLISIVCMAICTFILGVYFYMKDQDSHSVANIGFVPIVALCVFIIMFSIGYGPVPWMMSGEVFSTDIKDVASSIAGAFNWSLAFLITSTFATLNATFGNGQTFWIFSAFCIAGIFITFLIVPETKGKSLAEIQLMLSGEKVLSSESGNTTTDSKL